MAASERLGRVQVITPHVLQFLIRMPLVMWKGERQGMSDGARRHCMSGLCFLGRSADAWTAEDDRDVLHRHMGVRVGYLILITVFEVPCAYGGCAGRMAHGEDGDGLFLGTTAKLHPSSSTSCSST